MTYSKRRVMRQRRVEGVPDREVDRDFVQVVFEDDKSINPSQVSAFSRSHSHPQTLHSTNTTRRKVQRKTERRGSTHPVGNVVAFPKISSNVWKLCGPVNCPPATRQSFVSNLMPVGVDVQMMGVRPMASEIARTRSSGGYPQHILLTKYG